MKILLLNAFALFWLAACTNPVGNTATTSVSGQADSPLVTLVFSTPVNGYEVTAHWKPADIVLEKIIGPALLEFKKAGGKGFWVSTDHFSVAQSQLPTFQYSEEKMAITGIDQGRYQIAYAAKTNEPVDSFTSTDAPFFFQDVNFDKQLELIIAEAGQAQRHYNAYKVYELYPGVGVTDLSGSVPFGEIDGLTKLDYELQHITINKSGGACNDEIFTYFRSYGEESDKGEIKLGKSVRYEIDQKTGKCMEIVDMVTN